MCSRSFPSVVLYIYLEREMVLLGVGVNTMKETSGAGR